jgi:hypothetical protein
VTGRVMAHLTKLAAVAFGAMAALMLAGCGERPQVIDYKQGKYQGKPDEPPYAAAPFNGDQQKWERDIRARTQNQNEYKRTGS